MKKLMLFASAVALVAFSSCTNEDALVLNEGSANAENAISFSSYTAGQSRATNVNFDLVAEKGFGVFAYSTDQTPMETYIKSEYTPNFMYNQKVTSPDGDINSWTYSPIKYWPNNPGAMVSFFAYAPYIPEFSGEKYLETADKNNYLNKVDYVDSLNVRLHFGQNYSGPGIEYKRPADPTLGVDLLWGEYKGESVDDLVENDYIDNTLGDPAKAAIDLKKQAVGDKICFQFHHALSRMHFNIQVWNDTIAAQDDTISKYGIDENTKITINKVELVGNFPSSGTLRLADGSWNIEKENVAQTIEFSDTLLADTCRKGMTGDAASKEIDLLKGHSMEDGEMIDENEVDNFVMAIPTDAPFYIRLTYTVETVDPENPKNNSKVVNTVCSTDSNAKIYDIDDDTESAMDQDGLVPGLKAGYAYDFHLNIGMTSVKFAAAVDQWHYQGNEIDLPQNYLDHQN